MARIFWLCILHNEKKHGFIIHPVKIEIGNLQLNFEDSSNNRRNVEGKLGNIFRIFFSLKNTLVFGKFRRKLEISSNKFLI